MYCRHCGQLNEDRAERCVRCEEPLRLQTPPAPAIPSYLPLAILATVLCCMPLGVPAIVFAAQVNGLVALGDLEGAQRASRLAKILSWTGIGLGLVVAIVYIAMISVPLVLESFK